MLRSIGTGPLALAGRYTVRFIRGPSGLSPILPATRLMTAVPPRAPASVSATSQVTSGAPAGTRP